MAVLGDREEHNSYPPINPPPDLETRNLVWENLDRLSRSEKTRFDQWCCLEHCTFGRETEIVRRLTKVYGMPWKDVRTKMYNLGHLVKQIRELLKIKANTPLNSVEKLITRSRKFITTSPWLVDLPIMLAGLCDDRLNGIPLHQHPMISEIYELAINILNNRQKDRIVITEKARIFSNFK